MIRVMDILKQFSGVTSLELFSLKALNTSMAHLLSQWHRCNPSGLTAG
jgi:hypothetical protein